MTLYRKVALGTFFSSSSAFKVSSSSWHFCRGEIFWSICSTWWCSMLFSLKMDKALASLSRPAGVRYSTLTSMILPAHPNNKTAFDLLGIINFLMRLYQKVTSETSPTDFNTPEKLSEDSLPNIWHIQSSSSPFVPIKWYTNALSDV